VSDSDKQGVLDKVKERFGIQIDAEKIYFVQLFKCDKLRPELYPTATLLWQILAYYEVVAEALLTVPCDLFIDTMGVGAAYPLVKFMFNTKILSYTHYPTISSDMVDQIDTLHYNYQVQNETKTKIKKLYYRVLMLVYSLGGWASY